MVKRLYNVVDKEFHYRLLNFLIILIWTGRRNPRVPKHLNLPALCTAFWSLEVPFDLIFIYNSVSFINFTSYLWKAFKFCDNYL